MPIRTVRITSGQREELIELCRQYSDLQKKAVQIRWALNDQVATLAGLVESGEVAGLIKDFTQIEVVSVAEWKEALLKRNGIRTVGLYWLRSHRGRPPATGHRQLNNFDPVAFAKGLPELTKPKRLRPEGSLFPV